MTSPRDFALKLRALLADGQWHSGVEIMQFAAQHIPPEAAYRMALSQGIKREGRMLGQIVIMGLRYKINAAMRSRFIEVRRQYKGGPFEVRLRPVA
jgi:hypothetical protein